MSSFKLLSQKNFLPYFLVQSLGAMNDNLYKNILLLFIAFIIPVGSSADSALLVNLAAGLFILPFFIFSGHAGWLADRYNKVNIIRKLKLLEVVLMLSAAISLYYQQLTLLFILLFFMGAQSAYFGPIKYAILPQVLPKAELLGANALVEMATFVAILGGTLLAGVVMAFEQAIIFACAGIIILAVLGWLAAGQIPKLPATEEAQVTNTGQVEKVGFYAASKQSIKVIFTDKKLLYCILLISWFWFLGASVLTQLPNLVKAYLSDNPAYVSILLAVFSLAVGIGSLLSNYLNKGKVKFTLVVPAAYIMAVACCGFYLALAPGYTPLSQLLTISALLTVLGIAGGVFIVPLYTFLQTQVGVNVRAQVIAANNIFNAIFMVVSAIVAIVILAILQMSLGHYFVVLGVTTAVFVHYYQNKQQAS